MSRFLDAMREQGKSAGDGAPGYKGEIVDASDVLGPRTGSQPPEQAPDELSIEPLSSDDPEPMAPSPDPHNTAEFNDQADQGQGNQQAGAQVITGSVNRRPVPEKVNSRPVPSVSGTDTSDHQQAAPNKSRLSVRSLDPLFYLIVGVAAVGLFACLYALITQNDAYFEREYQQLQKESVALQARLAASTRFEAALTAAASAQKETTAPAASVTPTTTPSASQETVTEDLVAQVDSDIQTPAASVAIPPEPNVEVVIPEVTANVVASQSDQQQMTAAESSSVEATAITATRIDDAASNNVTSDDASARDTALALLRREVENLRAAMSSQDQKISRLEQDNLELTSIVGQSKVNTMVDVPELLPSIPQVEAPITRPSDTLQTEAMVVASEQSILVSQPNPTVSIIEKPVLYTPQSGTDTEIMELVQQGYLAYQAKDFNAASGFYGKALEFDPYDRDTNLGVAATAQAMGDFKLAEDRYRHLLTLDPADEVAFSALLNLSVAGDQGAIIEYELAQHVVYVNNPQELYAILGNYYSQQQRWSKAESAYAIASSGSISNPDFLFNYAVTLDNLGRTSQAAEYYSQALVGINNASYSFDAEAVRLRLQSLLAGTE